MLYIGIPYNTCYQEFERFVTQGGLIIEIILFSLMGLSLFTLLVSCFQHYDKE